MPDGFIVTRRGDGDEVLYNGTPLGAPGEGGAVKLYEGPIESLTGGEVQTDESGDFIAGVTVAGVGYNVLPALIAGTRKLVLIGIAQQMVP